MQNTLSTYKLESSSISDESDMSADASGEDVQSSSDIGDAADLADEANDLAQEGQDEQGEDPAALVVAPIDELKKCIGGRIVHRYHPVLSEPDRHAALICFG